MAQLQYEFAKNHIRGFPIEAASNLFIRNSLRYANRFARYAGAIVPNDCYPQSIVSGGQTINVFHALLPVEPDLSRCHKFLWSARHGRLDPDEVIAHPDNLEVFVVLTCVSQERVVSETGRVYHNDVKVCDILFPGIWATQLWKKNLCLWHQKRQLLATNAKFPNGLLYADHLHLQSVLGDYATI